MRNSSPRAPHPAEPHSLDSFRNPQSPIRDARSPWRPRARRLSLLIAAFALFAVLIVARTATTRFTWWKDARFAGRVLAKEARQRDTGDPADPAAAVQDAGRHRFVLTIDTLDGPREHEVLLRVFQAVEPGWTVVKLPGTYRCTVAPPEGAPP
jgi:hypothetical protein